MNRRTFIASAVGAAVIPQLPVAERGYSMMDLEIVGMPQFPDLVLVEYEQWLCRVIALAFDMSPYVLGK